MARTKQQSTQRTLSETEHCTGSSSDTDVSPTDTIASTILEGFKFQEGNRWAKDKLEKRSQEGSTKNGTHLGRGGDSSPQQT